VEPTPSKARRRRCKDSTASFPPPLSLLSQGRGTARKIDQWGGDFISFPLVTEIQSQFQPPVSVYSSGGATNESIYLSNGRGREGKDARLRGRLKKATQVAAQQRSVGGVGGVDDGDG